MVQPAILLLEDGKSWKGRFFSSPQQIVGEVVFNTSLCGYEEILTDPSYCGQIVVMTVPHVGNYGITLEDQESKKIQVRALVVKEASSVFSSWRGRISLEEYLARSGVPGVEGIDTRGLVKHLRSFGAMRGIIATEDSSLEQLMVSVRESPLMEGQNLMTQVSSSVIVDDDRAGSFLARGEVRDDLPMVVVYDFGVKGGILRELKKRSCGVIVVPPSFPAGEALRMNPAGIVLSNGPGDPAACPEVVGAIRELMKRELPIFGICLGHQLMGLALGGKTYKLKFGHRGGNHPVKNLETGKVEMTAQNHGFSVDEGSLPSHVKPTHINLYDQTLEGLRHLDFPFFSVQYHPESSPGPRDSLYLFEEFVRMVGENKEAGSCQPGGISRRS